MLSNVFGGTDAEFFHFVAAVTECVGFLHLCPFQKLLCRHPLTASAHTPHLPLAPSSPVSLTSRRLLVMRRAAPVEESTRVEIRPSQSRRMTALAARGIVRTVGVDASEATSSSRGGRIRSRLVTTRRPACTFALLLAHVQRRRHACPPRVL